MTNSAGWQLCLNFLSFLQVSGKLGLLHASRGEGKERHLVVSKPGAGAVPELEGEATDAVVPPSQPGVVEGETESGTASADSAAGEESNGRFLSFFHRLFFVCFYSLFL